jgi:membrane associated rhomboid family serine protease
MHAARQLPSWLIFDVGQKKMKAVNEARVMWLVCAILLPVLAIALVIEVVWFATSVIEKGASASLAVGASITALVLWATVKKFRQAKRTMLELEKPDSRRA